MTAFVTIAFFGIFCGSLYNVEGTGPLLEPKVGQCPYLLSVPKNCDFKCKSDFSCYGPLKCCSNGCGTECTQPLSLTMCQHQRLVAQHHVEQSTTTNKFIPECKENGTYKNKQCDLVKKECWCVDFRGFEISQTRIPLSNPLDCSEKPYSGNCPLYHCKKDCDHGFELDDNGCRTCACVDPCASIKCFEAGKSCTLFNVQCKEWPCPSVPLCSFSSGNPCVNGEPLKINKKSVVCDADSPCPFTHMCRSSVISNRSYCCPEKGKCPPFTCSLSCRHGYSYDSNECPVCECYEPCKTILCPPPKTCKVQQVQCFRAPCPPIAYCK